MQDFNFQQSQVQLELISSYISQYQQESLSQSLSQNQMDKILQTTLLKIPQVQKYLNLQYTSINQDVPAIDYNDGLILNLNENKLKEIKNNMIRQLVEQFQLRDDFSLLNRISSDRSKIYSNSLMSIREQSVSKDLDEWVSYDLKSLDQIKQNFTHIRYFYFKATESYLKAQPPANYGQKIVKYKSQITVLIGIIEQCLDQPLIYSSVFQKIIEYLKSYETSLNKNEEVVKAKSTREMADIFKQLFFQRTQQINSFEINQNLYKYLNNSDEPSSILMTFVKFLIQQTHQNYQAEDMSVFWKALNVQVISQFNDRYEINTQSKDTDMEIYTVYENISTGIYSFNNCFLLYKKPFLRKPNQPYDEVLPVICATCNSTNLHSTQYVIEIEQNQKRQRICYKCYIPQTIETTQIQFP